MELFIVLWCLEVLLLFWSQWVYVVVMVRDWMVCLWFVGGEVYHWFTCSDTLSPSNVSAFSSSTSRLANSVESAKINKYSISHLFPLFPSCVEILGTWGSQYKRIKSRLGVYYLWKYKQSTRECACPWQTIEKWMSIKRFILNYILAIS